MKRSSHNAATLNSLPGARSDTTQDAGGTTTHLRHRAMVYGCSNATNQSLEGAAQYNMHPPPTMNSANMTTHGGEENTMQLLRQLNYNLQETTQALCGLKHLLDQSQSPVDYEPNSLGDNSIKMNQKAKIDIRVQILNIWGIDTVKGVFSGEVVVQSKWHDPALDELSEDETDSVNWDTLWMPSLSLANISTNQSGSSATHDVLARAITVGKNGLNMVLMKRHVIAEFNFAPRLGLYPFDAQCLPIQVISSRDVEEVELEEDEYETCSIQAISDDKTACNDFRLYSRPSYSHAPLTAAAFSLQPLLSATRDFCLDPLSGRKQPVLTCTAFACRNWMLNLFTCFLPTFLLTFLCLLAAQKVTSRVNDSSSQVSASESVNELGRESLVMLQESVSLIILTCFLVFLSAYFSATSLTSGASSNLNVQYCKGFPRIGKDLSSCGPVFTSPGESWRYATKNWNSEQIQNRFRAYKNIYTMTHAMLVLGVALKSLGEQLGIVPHLKVHLWGFGGLSTDDSSSVEFSHLVALLLFLSINLIFYSAIFVGIFVRYVQMKRQLRRLNKRETDYKMLRSAREQSVQSFSTLTRQGAYGPLGGTRGHRGGHGHSNPVAAPVPPVSEPWGPTLSRSVTLPGPSPRKLKEIPV